jgi:hypothetical protein
MLIGEPDEVLETIVRHSEALGGLSRATPYAQETT